MASHVDVVEAAKGFREQQLRGHRDDQPPARQRRPAPEMNGTTPSFSQPPQGPMRHSTQGTWRDQMSFLKRRIRCGWAIEVLPARQTTTEFQAQSSRLGAEDN